MSSASDYVVADGVIGVCYPEPCWGNVVTNGNGEKESRELARGRCREGLVGWLLAFYILATSQDGYPFVTVWHLWQLYSAVPLGN